MESLIELLKTDTFLFIIWGMMALLLMGFIILLFYVFKLNKRYHDFMKKIGNGESIEEDLANYMSRVEKVEKQNEENLNYSKQIDSNLKKCIQKVGIVRYSAFKDTGSDLSFALALLDENNDGIVLNGIYSREMSNIYAKPVQDGKSKYTISEEEAKAIEKATNAN